MKPKRISYVYPIAVCSVCGRERPCGGASTGVWVCHTCRRSSRPKSPSWPLLARCSVCGQTKKCRRNRASGLPRCCVCSKKRELCVACDTFAPVEARTPRGPECKPCTQRRMHSKITCSSCERQGRPSITDARVCERCAGEEVRQVCRGCGAEETNYAAGRCARCVLQERLDELTRKGNPAAVDALKGYLVALVENPKPYTVLRWMGKSRGFQTLVELLSGALPLTHEALDGVDRGQSTIFLRAALVRHGALGERHGQSAALATFINREVLRVPDGPDRLAIRTFATWKVQHELARAERQGHAKRTSQHYARTKIRVAADLLVWLAEHTMTLGDLRQEHLDYWLAEGSIQRTRIRIFIAWAARRGIMERLTAPPPATCQHVDPLDPHERLRLIRTLLDDESLDLSDRVAGCLLLLFAQPISRLVLLTKDDVQDRHGQLFITLGREPLLLPEPLATLTRRLKDRQSGPASTGVKLSSKWLLPGLRLDTAIHEEAMGRRLRRLGITSRASRNAAALQLAKTLPAAILADLLGFDETTAEDWTQLANGDWARYAAAR